MAREEAKMRTEERTPETTRKQVIKWKQVHTSQ